MDPLKPLLPEAWRAEPYFSKLDALVGVPVINVHMCAARVALILWLALRVSAGSLRLVVRRP